ncbi:flagellar biosynthetic protein FliR [Longirhabdus pacifica]|uniref:flagellar biosynthetic protein FliR n=1 Tax=Longirhabdus pacifica TaxID=2305227 RepID=UPI0027BA2603|nr:flagellar biosynthetic protein FliR [Longirhabdus pacifica]
MRLLQLILDFLPSFLLVLCRISAFFVSSPIFSFRGIPPQAKVGLAFFISFIVFFSAGLPSSIPLDVAYMISVVREILIGLALGFAAYIFFTAIQISGSFVDLQMGFGIVNVFDPMTGAQSPIIGNFKYVIATLLFLVMDGHHYLLKAVVQSFEWIPFDNTFFNAIYDGDVSNFMLQSFVQMFSIALQMSAPLVAALFLSDVALGILSKITPQFNVFVVGIPFKIIVGFLILLLMIPGFAYLFGQLFETMFTALDQLLQVSGT